MLKRVVKILLIIVGALVVLIIVGVIVLYALITRSIDGNSTKLADLPLHSWAHIKLSAKTKCSDGSDYQIYVQRGESDNLLVHFAGGGACWNAETCAKPITITDTAGYYFPFIWKITYAFAGGIFSRDNADNPFRDWNEVYIPYCTADFDIGAATPTYTLPDGKMITIQHAGRQNVTEAFDWVFANFDHPPRLLISGESAGGFASIFWTPTISQHYPTSQIYQLADGVFLKTPRWPEIVDQVWKADSPNTLGFNVDDDIADNAYLHYAQNPSPNVTYMHINTVYDGVLTFFNAKLNNVTDDTAYREIWSHDLRSAMNGVANSGLKYAYYLTDYGRSATDGTTPHTSISGDLFYKIEQDGVFLQDWVKRIVIDGERFSVGSEFMNSS